MADYHLEPLGTSEFENMSQALVEATAGPGVKVFGVGRDGGRELTMQGRFGVPEAAEPWTGYTVAQVKFRARPDPRTNAEWLRNEIRKELVAWSDPDRNRTPKPTNLLFISNGVLSSVPEHGIDHVNGVFADFATTVPLTAHAVWHFDHMCRLLDNNASVRAAYAGLITPGDVLTELRRTIQGNAIDVGAVLRRHAAMELVAEQWVRLGSAGAKNAEKLLVGQVGVDLAATHRDADGTEQRVHVIDHVVTAGDAVLRSKWSPGVRSPHMVVVGGPGQGKTTIGQLICQIYRAALIDDLSSIGPSAARVVTTLRQHLIDGGRGAPRMKRWPLRLELSQYANVLAGSPQTSLLRFVAGQVSERMSETVTPAQLRTWLEAWPWLLVLDGFDEVVAVREREALVQRVSDFLIEAANVDADLLIVATTRPQGYAAEFNAEDYDHLQLTPLTPDEALAFAAKLADVRHADDPDGHRNVMDRIAEAAAEPLTARLMGSPLQVTIMSLLLEGRPRVPQDRYGLFGAYYDTLYNREVSKPTATGRLLELHRRTVDALHEQVGLHLQIEAEGDGTAEATLPRTDLESLATALLREEEYSDPEARDLAAKLATAALSRLVFLAPKKSDDVGFDVRSLQEFMAARAVTTGTDEQVLSRLRQLALSAHWRNTWLLAAGRIAAGRDHLVNDVIHLLSEIDADNDLLLQLAPGADLALELMDDKFAGPSPRVERLLLKKAVDVIQRAPGISTPRYARILARVAADSASPTTARVILDAARTGLACDPPVAINAAATISEWERETGPLGLFARQKAQEVANTLKGRVGPAWSDFYGAARHALPSPKQAAPGRRRPLSEYLEHGLGRALTDADEDLWRRFLASLQQIVVTEQDGFVTVPSLVLVRSSGSGEPLARPEVANRLAERRSAIPDEQWAVASAISDVVRMMLQRLRIAPSALQTRG